MLCAPPAPPSLSPPGTPALGSCAPHTACSPTSPPPALLPSLACPARALPRVHFSPAFPATFPSPISSPHVLPPVLAPPYCPLSSTLGLPPQY
eukprot:880772-Rhodomonas_salina.1